MKNITLSILFLIVFTQTAISQETIGFSNPGETYHLENYRLPTWGYDLFYLDFDGSFSSINQFNDTEDRNMFGRVNPNYFFYRESEDLIIDARAQLPLQLNRSSSETAGGIESSASEFQTNLMLSGNGNYYLQDRIFATGQTVFDINTMRRTTDGDIQPEVFRREADSRFLISAGVGFGRVRNVTPVIRALRFNERLNALNAGALNDGQIQNMAGVFAKRTGYNRVFDRPNRLFWDEISNVAPGTLGNLSFYEAYYLSETLLESTGQRFEGWDAAGVLFVDHRRYSEEREQNGTTTLDIDGSESRYGVDLGGRFFHNLSLEQMISLRANLGIGMISYSDVDDSENLFQLGLELGHLYNITDRILLQSAISNNYERISIDDDSVTDRVFRINSTLTYFIENNVSVSANVSYRNEKIDFGNGDMSRSNFGINVSLRYYFLQSLF